MWNSARPNPCRLNTPLQESTYFQNIEDGEQDPVRNGRGTVGGGRPVATDERDEGTEKSRGC